SSHGIEQNQQPPYFLIFLDLRKLGKHMLIFGSLGVGGQTLVSLYLPDNAEQPDGPAARYLPQFQQFLFRLFLHTVTVLFFSGSVPQSMIKIPGKPFFYQFSRESSLYSEVSAKPATADKNILSADPVPSLCRGLCTPHSFPPQSYEC